MECGTKSWFINLMIPTFTNAFESRYIYNSWVLVLKKKTLFALTRAVLEANYFKLHIAVNF